MKRKIASCCLVWVWLNRHQAQDVGLTRRDVYFEFQGCRSRAANAVIKTQQWLSVPRPHGPSTYISKYSVNMTVIQKRTALMARRLWKQRNTFSIMILIS